MIFGIIIGAGATIWLGVEALYWVARMRKVQASSDPATRAETNQREDARG